MFSMSPLLSFFRLIFLFLFGEIVFEYLINHILSMLLKGKSPFELLHNKPPEYDLLYSFGCLCYIRQSTPDKFQSRSRNVFFLCSQYKFHLIIIATQSIILVIPLPARLASSGSSSKCSYP